MCSVSKRGGTGGVWLTLHSSPVGTCSSVRRSGGACHWINMLLHKLNNTVCLFACWMHLKPKLFKLPFSEQPWSHLGGSEGSVADGEDAIGPLVRDGVKLAVQLAHGDGFGVDDCDLHLVLFHQTLVTTTLTHNRYIYYIYSYIMLWVNIWFWLAAGCH